ncbi:hypothetical protein FB45DRAFT_898853 [Roridomyces roridus]|uniref:F-box domain-containing protein n=1 Tax=Roridomyces roridus TaxID=1738132 RepID=A0AAD7FVG5_9AGAR|nr:hypothetical protein FB45DRAFT_898853 [Roridomyces roridus]
MGAATEIPVELWLKILDGLPASTMRAVYNTHRFFRPVCAPFLHSHFLFRPYYRARPTSSIRLPLDEKVSDSLERLAFWTSDKIAPLVRSCHVEPWPTADDAKTDAAIFPTAEPLTLLDPFYKRLGSFTNMVTLEARLLHFTPEGVEGVCALPNLKKLRLVSCTAAWSADESHPYSLSVTHLSIDSRLDFSTELVGGFESWLSLLRPECIESLKLPWNREVAIERMQPIATFSKLRKLRIRMDASTIDQSFIDFLLSTRVEDLDLRGPGTLPFDRDITIPTPFMPRLKAYSGPISTMRLFLKCPNLVRLTAEGNVEIFRERLLQLSAPPNVTSLSLILSFYDLSHVVEVISFFPHLTELRITITDSRYNSDYLTQLVNHLPNIAISSTLKRLAVTLRDVPRFSVQYPKFDYAPARRRLLQHHPVLETVWFSHAQHYYSWRLLGPAAEGGEREKEEKARNVQICVCRRSVCVCLHVKKKVDVDGIFERFWGKG